MRNLQLHLDPGLCAALEELARRKLLLEHIQAQKEQEAMARQMREAKSVDGMGELQMRVHSTAYHDWGMKHGFDCWKDEGFKKYFRKIAPETRVKCGGTKLMVGYQPGQEQQVAIFGSGNEPRFRKRYDE